jgi:hypothetical protein
LHAVRFPSADPRVSRVRGEHNLPAVNFERGSRLVAPARLYLPPRMFSDFSILVSVRPADSHGGFLFANMNPFDTIIELGATECVRAHTSHRHPARTIARPATNEHIAVLHGHPQTATVDRNCQLSCTVVCWRVDELCHQSARKHDYTLSQVR